MKNKKTKLASLSLIGLSLLSVKSIDVSATPNENVRQVPSEIAEVVEKETVDKKNEEVMKLNSDISKMVIKQEEKETSIKEKTTAIEKNQIELKDKIESYTSRYEIAEKRLLNLQAKDEAPILSYINALISSDDITEAMSRVFAVNIMNQANGDLMTQLENERISLEKLAEDLNLEKETLKKEKASQDVLVKQLNEKKVIAEKEKAELNKKWDKQEAEKKRLTELQKSMSEEAKRYLLEEQKLVAEQDSLLARMKTAGYVPNAEEQKLLGRMMAQKTDLKVATDVVSDAFGYLGVPYVWGGATPKGFDCSGLVQWVYGRAGIEMPRVSEDQSRMGEKVPLNQLEKGDLLYWGPEGSSYHVAIYIGNNQFIHAPKPGDSVKITKMEHFMPSFAKRVIKKAEMPQDNTFVSQASLNVSAIKDDSLNYDLYNGVFHSTHYSAYDGAQIGITAGGTNMANGNIHTKDGYRIVAVDSRVIPLGTILRVTTGDGQSFLAKADDTGSAIKGNRLDIAVSSKAEAFKLGTTTAIIEKVTSK